LLGTIARGDQPLVRIESVEPVPDCTAAAFGAAARKLSLDGTASALGYYRTRRHPGFQPDAEDVEIVSRYFTEPEDLILLIQSEKRSIEGQLFVCGHGDELMALGEPFPLGSRCGKAPARGLQWRMPTRWTVFLPVLLLASFAVAFGLRQSSSRRVAPVASTANSPVREPIRLNVQATGQNWLVWWNPMASRAAGSVVRLFVREDGVLTRLDLSPQDLESGTYEYRSPRSELTFRLERTESGGLVSAESFRLFRPVPTADIPVADTVAPSSAAQLSRQIAPGVLHKVAPVIPPGIRSRTNGSVPIDLQVSVDEKGRVVSAVPVSKPHSGLEAYLVDRAVDAVRQWEFAPARRNGVAVAGSQKIHLEL